MATGWERLRQSLDGIEDDEDDVSTRVSKKFNKVNKETHDGNKDSKRSASAPGTALSTLVNELLLPKTSQKERRGSILSVGSSNNSRRGSTISQISTTSTSRWKSGALGKLIGKNKKQKQEEEFMVEARRRFLFDDTKLRTDTSEKEVFPRDEDEKPMEDIDDVVDQDDARVQTFVSQVLVGTMVESTPFRFFIFTVIIVNSILIGLQTSEHLAKEYRYLFSIFDQLVMATFICEILLKWYYGFWVFWKNGWNIMDFVIILALILGPQVSFLASSRILRILRVLRAFRSLRSISALAGLSMVVQTILQSVPDMANICLMMMIILVVLGVMGVTFFGETIPHDFGNLPTAMFSLFICVTQDGWVNIFNQFREAGGELYVGGAFYFFISIMLGAFVFANLVVAVVVTNLEMAMKELREEKAAEVDTLTTTTKAPSKDPDGVGETEEPEAVKVQTFKSILSQFDMSTQQPLQHSEIRGVNDDKIEKYFLLLIALEENLVEYLRIRNDLEKVYEVVTHLNIEGDYLDDHDYDLDYDESSATNLRMTTSQINASDFTKGDILSNLMKLEDQSQLTSRGQHTIKDVLRSAFDSVDKEGKVIRRGSRT